MIGDSVGGFTIVSRFGRSALGELWHARDGVIVELLPEGTASFAACEVAHVHLARPRATGTTDGGRPYLVYAELRGEPLPELILRAGRLPSRQVADLAGKIASALDALHGAGHLHRGLASAGIFVDGDEITVLDAGLSTTAPHGTVASYAAPETWDPGATLDARADIYALGAITFEMASGRAPFVGSTPDELPQRHALAHPPALAALVPDVAKTLDLLVQRMLAKDPGDRPRAAKELSFVFELVENNEAVPSLGSTIKQAEN